MTKCDEAERLGEVLGCVIEQQLVLAATCDGQEIPRDLWAADAMALVAHMSEAAGGDAPLTVANEQDATNNQGRMAINGG